MNPPSSFPKVPTTNVKPLDALMHSQLARLSGGMSPISLGLAYADWALHLATSPQRQLELAQHAMQYALQATTPSTATGAAGAATEKDGRFADPSWNVWPFNVLKDSYMAGEKWWNEATEVDGMSRHHGHMVKFFARQGMDALSPSNWAATNPEVLKQTQQTFGQNLMHGMENLNHDLQELQKSRAETDGSELAPLPYAVGKDVAITPGKVVFRNALIELIHYTPSTGTVYPEPLLIVPSCIMKYYILDLSPANSMVRYLVAQGYQVFMISWRNPDASDRALGMQDYLRTGVMEAIGAVGAHTGAPRIHALGYCLGGTFLAIVAAALGRHAQLNKPRGDSSQPALKRRRDDAVGTPFGSLPELATVTLLAAQTDFSEPGELGVFIDDDQLKTLREDMAKKGYLSGRQMAGSFQFLNSRDLVWSRNTRRYLMGLDEVGNDMMSWNADLTRLPERMHNEYLSSLFLNNALANGHYRVGDMGVALMDIRAPMLVVGTVRDHVSPWRSVYKIHLQTDTETTFILAAGGHNAGIVSEPGHPHRSYQMASAKPGHDWVEPEVWQAQTPHTEGSWWEALDSWLAKRSGARVATPAFDASKALCDAPGEYVMVRYAD